MVKYDRLIEQSNGPGAMVMFKEEVVAVVLSGRRLDLDFRRRASKVDETPTIPKVRLGVKVKLEPRYVNFIEPA